MLEMSVLLGLLMATLLFCLNKWGWFEYYEIFRPKWLRWIEPCMFCFAFRILMIFCFTAFLWNGNWQFLIIPFIAAPISIITYNQLTK